MPVFVCYVAPVSYRKEPVTFAGIFRSRDHFDDWQTRERQRACYTGQPFCVQELRVLTQQEHQRILEALRT